MTPFVVVLGIVGAVLILVGLVGGGFTLSGSFMPGVGMPKVGNWVRLPCFGVGVLLVLVSIALGFGSNPAGSAQSAAPAAATNPATTSGPTSAASASPSPSNTSNLVAVGVVRAPQGYSTVYAYELPYLSASVATQVADGTTVGISCTAQGDVVTNPDTGQSSSLWDGTSDGYIPDVYVDTGTNQATMGSC